MWEIHCRILNYLKFKLTFRPVPIFWELPPFDDLCTTGNGGIVMGAVTHVEPAVVVASTQRQQPLTAFIVTELPYQVIKAALLEQIADLVNDKKLEGSLICTTNRIVMVQQYQH
jgi:hypothetical protein